MTDITAAMVKQLRDATSAGMMECKRALVETNGDFDEAVKLLREKGMASAAKRADRETSEGKVGVMVRENVGAIALTMLLPPLAATGAGDAQTYTDRSLVHGKLGHTAERERSRAESASGSWPVIRALSLQSGVPSGSRWN